MEGQRADIPLFRPLKSTGGETSYWHTLIFSRGSIFHVPQSFSAQITYGTPFLSLPEQPSPLRIEADCGTFTAVPETERKG